MNVYPSSDTEYSPEHIRTITERIRTARTRGALARELVRELERYTLFDLQIIGGRLNSDIEKLPSPYREAVRPYFRDQIFGMHHRIVAMNRKDAFCSLEDKPFRDPDLTGRFWDMVPEGCFTWSDASERNPYFQNPKNRLFYYLIAAFAMFVLDEPGHPVGMPFPGGFRVEQRGKDYYCLIRDKEKDVFWSICNFCPAKQSEETGPIRK
jgi:uncharacterized protein (UPF0305 family)